MRPTTFLNPRRMKTAREAVGLTQTEAARLVSPKSQEATALTSYQRIERNGRTSPKRAIKIAEVLNVSLDDLLLNEELADVLLWISHEGDGEDDEERKKLPGLGATHDSAILFWELGRILKQYPLKFDEYGRWKICAQCNFNGESFHIRMCRRAINKKHGTEEHRGICAITIRFCKFDSEKGLLWLDADQHELDFIAGGIKSILFLHADFFVMNRTAFPPADATCCYYIEAYKQIWRDSEIIPFRGNKFFTSRFHFIRSLETWLNNNPLASIHKMANGLTIQQLSGSKEKLPNILERLTFYREIKLRYGWLDCDSGAFEEAPWPEYDRANLEAKKFVLFPSDYPEKDDDLEVPTFEPDMIEARY